MLILPHSEGHGENRLCKYYLVLTATGLIAMSANIRAIWTMEQEDRSTEVRPRFLPDKDHPRSSYV